MTQIHISAPGVVTASTDVTPGVAGSTSIAVTALAVDATAIATAVVVYEGDVVPIADSVRAKAVPLFTALGLVPEGEGILSGQTTPWRQLAHLQAIVEAYATQRHGRAGFALQPVAVAAEVQEERLLIFDSITCEGLKNRDCKGKSDPFVRIVALPSGAQAETSRKDNTLKPSWDEPLTLKLGPADGAVRVEVWDWDRTGAEALGQAELALGTAGGQCELPLLGSAAEVKTGVSKVRLEWHTTGPPPSLSAAAAAGGVAAASRRLVVHTLRAAHLLNRDAKGNSDPFIRLVAITSGAQAETARKENALDPVWERGLELTLGPRDEKVRVEVWDWDKGGPQSLGHAILKIEGGARTRTQLQLQGGKEEVDPEANSHVTLEYTASGHWPVTDAGVPARPLNGTRVEVAEQDASLLAPRPAAGAHGDILALQPEAKDAAFALLGLGPTAAESAPAAPLLSLSGFSASGLKNRDPFGPDTNPFLRFTALRANRSSGESVTTSAASNTLNPVWPGEALVLRLDGASQVHVQAFRELRAESAGLPMRLEALGSCTLNLGRSRGELERLQLRGGADETTGSGQVRFSWQLSMPMPQLVAEEGSRFALLSAIRWKSAPADIASGQYAPGAEPYLMASLGVRLAHAPLERVEPGLLAFQPIVLPVDPISSVGMAEEFPTVPLVRVEAWVAQGNATSRPIAFLELALASGAGDVQSLWRPLENVPGCAAGRQLGSLECHWVLHTDRAIDAPALQGGGLPTVAELPAPFAFSGEGEVEAGARLVTLRGISCAGLMNRDKKGKSDPYIKFRLSDKKGSVLLQTRRRNNTLDPKWEAEEYEVTLPSAAAELWVEVFDHDAKGSDEPLGHTKVAIDSASGGGTWKLQGSKKEVHEGVSSISFSWSTGGTQAPQPIYGQQFGRRTSSAGLQLDVLAGVSVGTLSGGSSLAITNLRCDQLMNRDKKGKSDPYIKFKMNDKKGAVLLQAPRIDNTLNPRWKGEFELKVPDACKGLWVEVFDHDMKSDEVLGHAYVPLELAAKRGSGTFKLEGSAAEVRADSTVSFDWVRTANAGVSGVVAPLAVSGRVLLITQLSCAHLRNADRKGKSDPWVKALLPSGVSARTKTLANTLSPSWTADKNSAILELPLGAGDATIKLEVWDEDKGGKGDALGYASLTLSGSRGNIKNQRLRGKVASDVLADSSISVIWLIEERNVGAAIAQPQPMLIISDIFCTSLKNRDVTGLSDPFVVVRSGSGQGETPRKDNTLDPEWTGDVIKFPLLVAPADAVVSVEVLDWDKAQSQTLGKCDFTIALAGLSGRRTFPLAGASDEIEASSTVTLSWRVEQPGALMSKDVPAAGKLLTVKALACTDLKNRDKKGKSDPFVRIVAIPSGLQVEVARKDDTLNPTWEDLPALAVLNSDTAIRLEVWDWDRDGNDSMGHAEVRLDAEEGSGRFALDGNASEVEKESAITFAWGLSANSAGRRVRFTRIACANLKNRDAVGVTGRNRSDPFVRLVAPGGSHVETKRQDNTLSPCWDEPYELPLAASDMSVRLEAWDWDPDGGNDSLGHARIDLVGERGRVSVKLQGGAQEVRKESVIAVDWEIVDTAGGAASELLGPNVLRGTWRGGSPWEVVNGTGWTTHPRHGWHFYGSWKGGMRHGAGACVYPDGSVFVGEWRDGQWWGSGSLRTREGDSTLTGTYYGRLDHSVADVLITPSGDKFHGDLVQGQRHGTGRCAFRTTAISAEKGTTAATYEGEWEDDVPHGQGVYSDGANTYAGSWEHGLRHGHGRHEVSGGSTYDGEWQNGLQHGWGRIRGADGTVHEGLWVSGVIDDSRPSKTERLLPDGTRYVGGWQGGVPKGRGTVIYANGERFDGTFAQGIPDPTKACTVVRKLADGHFVGEMVDGLRHGFGILTQKSGDTSEGTWSRGMPFDCEGVVSIDGQRYAGAWRGGYREGHGVLEWQTGERFIGGFLHGLQHGFGVCEYADGERYEGMWVRGLPRDNANAQAS